MRRCRAVSGSAAPRSSHWRLAGTGLAATPMLCPSGQPGRWPFPLQRREIDHSSTGAEAMIKSYSEHAANARTFLAWIRTAIAMMAFGFLLERFDLFLQIAAVTLGPNAPRFPSTRFGRDAGLGLLLLGVGMMIVAAVRFLRTREAIDSPDSHVITGTRLDVALAVLLALLGVALVFYLTQAIVSHT